MLRIIGLGKGVYRILTMKL